MTDQTALQLQWITPDQAGASMRAQFIPYVKEKLEAGLCLAVSVMELEDARTLRQNAFMWGVVLKEISEQATLGGIGATPEGWHLFFKRKFLGYEYTKTKLPGAKRPSVTKTLRSTKGLSVKKMSVYLEQVIAEAVTVFDVRFSERDWQKHR